MDWGRLFEKYYRGVDSRGTGVGLYLVRRIIEEHGGEVHANEVVPGMFRVDVRIPRLREENQP